MLKLLAIQVLKDCEEHIMRCLEPDMIYYLCHDYEITRTLNGGWRISKWDRYINAAGEGFYRISPDSKMNINISAIVGENGSGKSTLVELILRMINNCSIKFELRAESGRLEYVEGVHARLFYLNGKQICCLSVEGKQESIKVSEIAIIEDGEMKSSKRELSAPELKGHFFYTLVSNYSHYAYNTYDFRREWQKQTDEDTCWLKWLFHKNDGYQTPVNLHPYREQGTINIEREKNLSNQRLLYFFINYAKQKKENGVFKYINGKKPKYLNLRDAKMSKLQQVTLLRYFDDNKDVDLLGEQLDYIRSFGYKVLKLKSPEYRVFKDRILIPLENLTYRVLGVDKKESGRHYHFYKTIIDWMIEEEKSWQKEHGSKLFSRNSDVKQLINALESFVANNELTRKIQEICNDLKEFELLNLCQIQRLEILDDICDSWRDNVNRVQKTDLRFELRPELITTNYSELSQKEKCYHYIVYKTIDIFETYPSYKYPIWSYLSTPVSFNNAKDGSNEKKKVNAAFNQLISDVTEEKTHITLKMRQAFYYLKNSVYDQRGRDGYVLTGEKIKGVDGICLSTERLASFYKDENEQNLETLPPPIYERHLLFETIEGKLVDMDTFSSGEKQLLNTQSAVIYHLQNLNSIFKDPARMSYPQVNIILEEIELYFHPEYQRCFIYSLINLLESSGIDVNIKDVNIMIVTHSPFILSDIPKSNVLFLKNGTPKDDMQENTFGSNIHSMLTNGFFLPSLPIGEFAHEKINGMFEKLNGAQIDRESRLERNRLYSDIARVGEPYLREQLMRLFNMYYPPIYHDRLEQE